MRVIAGKYKGRTLIAPKGETRPTLDRTKETLFNIINFRLQDAVVLDLFAGSGQLAIESLSRGAKRAILCDHSRDAINAMSCNFKKVGVEPEVFFCGYCDCIKRLNVKCDIIFVDPPYQSGYYRSVLDLVDQYNILADDGIVICEHSKDVELSFSDKWTMYDSRKIGTVVFDFFERR